MTDKKIRLLIEAENTATPKLEEATKSVDKFGNEISKADAELGRFIDKAGRMREANGRFVNTTKEAARSLDDVRESAKHAGNELKKAGNKGKQSLLQLGNQAASTRAAISNLIMTAGLFGIGTQAIAMADEYKLLEGRLKLATDSTAEFANAQARLSEMAHDTRQSLSATTKLYVGIAPALKEAGKEQEAIFTVVDSVNKALVVSGATAQESAASILQLTQALGSGVLRGDEFNSIMENGRGIAQALADGLGLPIGALRKLAEEGKLTSEIVVEALIQQNGVITEKYKTLPLTVGQAMQQVQNKTLEAVGAFDKATGVSAALSSSLSTLSENVEGVAMVAGALAAIYGGKLAVKLAAHITATTAATLAEKRQAVATLYLSQTQNIATASTARFALAQRGLAASVTAGTVAARGLAGALAFLGGPMGLIVTLGIAGATAYAVYGDELDSTKVRAKELKQVEDQHAVTLEKSRQAAYKYADATATVRRELGAETAAAIDATRAELKLAQARVATAKQKLSTVRSAEENTSGSIKEGTKLRKEDGLGDSYSKRLKIEEGILSSHEKTLKRLETDLSNFGKTKVQLDKAYRNSSYEKAAANNVVAKSQEELRKLLDKSGDSSGKLTKAYDRQKIALTAQNIALKEGELAAYKYRLEQQGLSKEKVKALVAIKEENLGLQKLKREQQKTTKAKKKGASETEKAAQRVKKAFENQANALDIQNIKLREGEEAAERHRLKLQGFSDAQIEQLLTTKRANKALEEQQQQNKKNAQEIQRNAEQAKQAYESQQQTLKKQRIELTQGKAAAEAYALKLQGLSDAQIAELQATKASNTALEEQAKHREDVKQKLEQAQKTYESQKQTFEKQRIELTQGKAAAEAYALKLQGLSDAQIAELQATKANNTALKEQVSKRKRITEGAEKELQRLRDRSVSLKQNTLETYASTLKSKEFKQAIIDEALGLEYGNRLLAERQKLQQSRNKLSPNVGKQYEGELKQEGFNEKDIGSLVAEKMQIEQEKIMQNLQKQRDELRLTASAYRTLELSAKGFTQTQVKQITTQEAVNSKLKKLRAISDNVYGKLSEGLLKTVTGGKADWSGLIDYMIQEAMKLYVIQPLMNSLMGSSSSGGFLGSLFGGFFAKGGAFNSGQQVHAYAKGGTFTNQIYTEPTFFNFDGGKLGVMGEAGAEAVMPLHQAKDGGLGILAKVQAETPPISIAVTPQVLVDLSSQQAPLSPTHIPNIEVNIQNLGDDMTAKTSTRQNSKGGISLDIILEKIRGDVARDISSGGEVSESISDTFGLNNIAGAMR